MQKANSAIDGDEIEVAVIDGRQEKRKIIVNNPIDCVTITK